MDTILIRECAREGVNPAAFERVVESLLRAGHDHLIYPDLQFEREAAEERAEEAGKEAGRAAAHEWRIEQHSDRQRAAIGELAVLRHVKLRTPERARAAILSALEKLAQMRRIDVIGRDDCERPNEMVAPDEDPELATLIETAKDALAIIEMPAPAKQSRRKKAA